MRFIFLPLGEDFFNQFMYNKRKNKPRRDKTNKWVCTQRRLRSAWAADAQADPSLRWAHNHFVGFVMSRLKYSSKTSSAVRLMGS